MSKFKRGDEVRWTYPPRTRGRVVGYRLPSPDHEWHEKQVVVDVGDAGVIHIHENSLELVRKPPKIRNPFVAFNERGLVVSRADRIEDAIRAIRAIRNRDDAFVLDENTGTWYDNNGCVVEP